MELPPESKKRRVQKKPLSLNSKAKQIISDKPKKSKSSKRKRTTINELYDNIEDKFSVMERGGKLLESLAAEFSVFAKCLLPSESLAAEFPGFAKCMLPSNVTYSFWLIIPKHFCNLHLPRHDATITLVDECGQEYKTNFLSDRHGLSAGWRGFSIAHRLLKGDILIFHLAEPCKLKVHIVRVHGLDVIDAALCLMNMDASAKRTNTAKKYDIMLKVPKKGKRTPRRAKKHLEEPPVDISPLQLDPEDDGQGVSNVDPGLKADQNENSSDGFSSDVLEGPGITNQLQSNEPSCSGSSCFHDHLQEGISCRSTVQSFYSLSTLAI